MLIFFYEKEDLLVLDNLNFQINKGERVGIVGTNGCGKSSLVKLLMNLYQPKKGSILIDDVDHNQINPSDLRSQIGYVPQEVVLFYGTIKDNIKFGEAHIDDEIVLKAAKNAGVETFVRNHPDGYDFQVGERGAKLSQGQRQTIAIARSLLLSPHLMLLDEPCASMDANAESLVRDYLQHKVPSSTTLIVITHRPSMLRIVDRLIVLDNGKITMDGPRDSVLAKLNGRIVSPKKSQPPSPARKTNQTLHKTQLSLKNKGSSKKPSPVQTNKKTEDNRDNS